MTAEVIPIRPLTPREAIENGWTHACSGERKTRAKQVYVTIKLKREEDCPWCPRKAPND